ncbi:unnamed protein product [Pedinophyceae sp. YPF-701]|nr:unnamed protein product [Pedinophyceae sp. YPF-701]
MAQLAVRTRLLEYGLLPLAALLPDLRRIAHVMEIFRKLNAESVQQESNFFVDIYHAAYSVGLNIPQMKALVDVLDSVATTQVIRTGLQPGADTRFVDVHAVLLFLVSQLFERHTKGMDDMVSRQTNEVWPMSGGPHGMPSPTRAPGSPGSAGIAAAAAQSAPGFHSQLGHVAKGFSDFVLKHAADLVRLCSDRGHLEDPATIRPGEFDRLGLLLTQAGTGDPNTPPPKPPRLSTLCPLFKDGKPCAAPDLVAWLRGHVSPPSIGAAGIALGDNASAQEIVGLHRATVVRGEDACPSGSLRILGCHDSVIYALCPVQYCSLQGCTDCTVVVGAVGRMIRLERCERLRLIVACKRVTASTCHDCTLFLGTNRPPYMLGDNRFVQVAPYCTRYERLQAHLDMVRVSSLVNLWDQPVSLARNGGKTLSGRGLSDTGMPESPKAPRSPMRRAGSDFAASSPTAGASVGSAAALLPPDHLMPFVIPFQGAGGKIAGGAPLMHRGGSGREEYGLGGGMKVSDNVQGGVFPLPSEYAQALERKLMAVSQLRGAVKGADLPDPRKNELQAVVQLAFKDWLVSSGNMRQVQDIAKLEKDAGGGGSSSREKSKQGGGAGDGGEGGGAAVEGVAEKLRDTGLGS